MDDQLKSIQNTEYDILKYFDSFCRSYNIRYSLSCGTLLGAIRHKGFIPWDDDIDVCMIRNQYRKFIRLWEEQGDTDGYILQERHRTEHYYKNYAKLRKEHTTFLENREEAGKYHTGIFIDIFPIDYFPANTFKQVILNAFVLLHLFLSKRMKIDPNSRLSRSLEKIISGTSREKAGSCKGLNSYNAIKTYFPVDMFDEYTEVLFGDQKYMCWKKYHEGLTILYGDYMELPPEDERVWTHHPIIVSDTYDLDELIERDHDLLDR